MKIAVLVGSFPKISETFILNQITGLVDRGHDVDIFAGSSGDDSKVHHDVEKYNLLERTYYIGDLPADKFRRVLQVIPFILTRLYKNPIILFKALNLFKYGRKALSLQLLYWTIPFLTNDSYDILYCHFGNNGKRGALLKEIGAVNCPLITVFHGFDMSRYIEQNGKDVYDELFKIGDLFLPISRRWKDKLVDMGCPEEKIIVHRMGIDTDKFRFSERTKDGDVKLLSVGRFVEKKGLQYAIKAAVIVMKKREGVIYRIAGDGKLRDNIEKLINELGIENRIKLLGWQQRDEIAQLMHQSDILIAPSVTSEEGDQEGIPVTIMEALARGMPVVATQHSGIPELVQDGKSGYLVPERDIDALAEKLDYLIDHPDEWVEMGRNGREYVEENYDINNLNDRLVDIYKGIVSRKVL